MFRKLSPILTELTHMFKRFIRKLDYHADGGFWTRIARISRIFLAHGWTRMDTDFYHAEELTQWSGWRYSCDSWNSCSKKIRVLSVIRLIPFKFRGWINPMFRRKSPVFTSLHVSDEPFWSLFLSLNVRCRILGLCADISWNVLNDWQLGGLRRILWRDR